MSKIAGDINKQMMQSPRGKTERPHEPLQELYRDWETDRKSTRLNSSQSAKSRMPSSA